MRLSLAGQQSLAGSCYKRHAIRQAPALLLQPPPSDGWYAGGFRVSFIPLPGCFSPFPHGTRSLSVADGILALGRGRPSFPHGSTARVVLTTPAPPGATARRLRDSHPLRPAFPHRSAATVVLCSSKGTRNAAGPLRWGVQPRPGHRAAAHSVPPGLGSSPFARHYLGNGFCSSGY